MSDDLNDELPVDLDTEPDEGDEGTELWHWIAGAGAVVVGIYVLSWLFRVLAGLVGFLVYYGGLALLVYGAYRGVRYMLSGDSSANEASDRQVALPEDIDVESELETELGELESGGLEDGDLEGELEGLSLDDELDRGVEEVSVEASADRELEDDELERKFAELEREMNDS